MSRNLSIQICEYIVLFIAFGVLIGFGCMSYITNDGSWFSRLGSLTVILAAVLEYKNFGAQQYLREKMNLTWKPDPAVSKNLIKRNPFDISILLALIIVTLIWGYGDLLFGS